MYEWGIFDWLAFVGLYWTCVTLVLAVAVAVMWLLSEVKFSPEEGEQDGPTV